jgi:hypothetical protein
MDTTNERELSCHERLPAELAKVQSDIELYFSDSDVWEEGNDDLPPFHDYGLDFSFVAPLTFRGQHVAYYQYQLSWGGPSDEIRFFPDGRIEYWYLDWGDGACAVLTHKAWAKQLRSYFEECGLLDWSDKELYDYSSDDDEEEEEEDDVNDEDEE